MKSNGGRRLSLWPRLFPLLEWRELFSEPRLAVAALVFAITVGVVPAAAFNRLENERRLARQSIHFDVFAVDREALGAVFSKPDTTATNGVR